MKKAPKPNKLSTEKITLTIRAVTKRDVDALKLLKKLTGEKQYSRAVMQAAYSYDEMKKIAESRYELITKLQRQIQQSDVLLKFLSSSQNQLQAYAKKYLAKFPEPELFG